MPLIVLFLSLIALCFPGHFYCIVKACRRAIILNAFILALHQSRLDIVVSLGSYYWVSDCVLRFIDAGHLDWLFSLFTPGLLLALSCSRSCRQDIMMLISFDHSLAQCQTFLSRWSSSRYADWRWSNEHWSGIRFLCCHRCRGKRWGRRLLQGKTAIIIAVPHIILLPLHHHRHFMVVLPPLLHKLLIMMLESELGLRRGDRNYSRPMIKADSRLIGSSSLLTPQLLLTHHSFLL